MDASFLTDALFQLSFMAVPIIVAITFHEAAHGWVALRLGDDTAQRLGRVTFNPIRHIDPFGTLILPAVMALSTGFLFGWAKPVPVDFRRLGNPRRDMVWVALAGPGINIVLAVASALLYHVTVFLPESVAPWLQANLEVSVWINVILAVFNMLPLPPLDGGRVAVGVLPGPLARPLARLERVGILIILLVAFLLPYAAGKAGVEFDVMGWLVGGPAAYIVDLIMRLTGLSA
ncbi:MAG TPA: site-2 protease family protein [Azospirillaceae bacterium]|nr:site-2 protease family protein [Azospirillaceae bacterium]